ncbi:MAG: hypothetical protein F4X14_16820 [Caldilineaceae bacterium SB0661_bin_32]|uniref:Lipopolysaccharide biosynthesis protein n=1 Tax=Caldilineaceae bacterium SB0661_bin_32 TaxID=2605255 RepID=A0A6B1D9B5_9CHLR|nr:hypothetical protein [Caldilineaceae bacterium SB0661_bin_32]
MTPAPQLSTRGILKTWWPLALSWFMITVEQPILAAVVARSVDPKVQLAAWGLAFSLVLVLSAPSISTLAASTALSRDKASYRQGRRYVIWLSVGLTAAHLLLAFTPVFDLVVFGLISAPAELAEPVRSGVRIMLPFVPSLAIRRFQYGVLIRCDQTRAVSLGTVMRLILEVVLAVGLFGLLNWDGVIVASTAISTGVLFEAVYATLRVRPVVRKNLLSAIPGDPPLTWRRFLRFYLPLVLTTFMQILLQPLISASLSRMPDSLSSLALWPVLYGVLLMTNSAAYAFVESVIVLLDRPGSIELLRKFTWRLGLSLAAVPLALAITPLGDLWFSRIAALPPELLHQARLSLWLVIPLPALTALSSLFQGTLINSQRTRRITEADALALATITALLALGSLLGGRPCGESGLLLCGVPGVFIAVAAFNFGSAVRNVWLWRRSRRIYISIRLRHARA